MNQMTTTGQRIKEKRQRLRLSLQSVADKLDVNRSSVMRWENGETSHIKLPILERLAQILQTTPEYLMGYEEDDLWDSSSRNPLPESVCMIPVLDKIQVTDDTFEWQNISGYQVANAEFRHNSFFICITEDSMAPQLNIGDFVLIHRQNTLSNGDAGLFALDNGEAMIRLFYCENGVELRSCNPYFPSLHFDIKDKARLKIIGKVMESRRKW